MDPFSFSSLDSQLFLLFQVLDYLDDASRQKMIRLNRALSEQLTTPESFHWRLQKLQEEHGIYYNGRSYHDDNNNSSNNNHILTSRRPTNTNFFRELFLRQFRLVNLWKLPPGMRSASDHTTTPIATAATPTAAALPHHEFEIKTMVRFKPFRDISPITRHEKENVVPRTEATAIAASTEKPSSSTTILGTKPPTLPLSQQLTLLRLSYNLSSNQEALQLLGKKGGIGLAAATTATKVSPSSKPKNQAGLDRDHAIFISSKSAAAEEEEEESGVPDGVPKDSSETTQTSDPNNDNNSHSLLSVTHAGVHTIDSSKNRVIVVDRFAGLKELRFDTVLDADDTITTAQEDVYQSIGHPAVRNVLNGSNATILLYGQTGSGKTYTMMGTDTKPGILPRVCQELFQAMNSRQSPNNGGKNNKKQIQTMIQSQLSISYVELFGKELTDLLRPDGPQKVAYNMAAAHRSILNNNNDSRGDGVLGGASSYSASSLEKLLGLIARGNHHRKVAATNMNERSSRAHSLVFLNLRQQHCDSGVIRTSRLILGDLGGAEKLKQSQGNTTATTTTSSTNSSNIKSNSVKDWKQRTREAIHINQGLLALKNCVHALNQKASFVPYGDSKLTLLLSDGGLSSSKVYFGICASQDPKHALETLSSLHFGQACRNIQAREEEEESNGRRTTTDALLHDLLIQDLDRQIQECRERIRQTERWETQQMERSDGNGGVEQYTVSKIVGAEEFNAQLEQLLQRRGTLTGVNVLAV